MTDDARTPVRALNSFTQLAYREDGPVARITLSRPEVRNALSIKLSQELRDAIGLTRQSRSLRVVVIDGAGETFCAGDDITEMPDWGDANDVVRRVHSYQQMANAGSRSSTRSRSPRSMAMPSAGAWRSRWRATS